MYDAHTLSVVTWNIDGIHSKIGNGERKQYLEKFDVAVLVENRPVGAVG